MNETLKILDNIMLQKKQKANRLGFRKTQKQMVKKFIEYLEYLKNLKKNPPKIFGPEDATIFVIRTDSKGERNEENDL
jgi:hypothetical protein